MVDGRTFQVSNSPQVPADAHLTVVAGHAVVWTQRPFAVWRMNPAQLTERSGVDGLEPLVRSDGSGLVAVTPDGTVLALDVAGQQLLRLPARRRRRVRRAGR